jgi:hypothetical protein
MAIAQVIQIWGLAREQGRWQQLSDTFTPDGRIHVTWFHGAFADFVAASRRVYQPTAPRPKHVIGLPVVSVVDDRAMAETNIQILGRFRIGQLAIDNTSHARFLDKLVHSPKGWRICDRVAIYEKDRLDPVHPDPAFDRLMAETDFSAFPEPYRYLGHRLHSSGRPLVDGILCDGAPAAMAAIDAAQDWLRQG